MNSTEINLSQSAAAVFDKHAQGYQEKFMDVSLYHNALDQVLQLIPNDQAAILDIACGPGNIARYLLDKRPGFQITGIDLAPNMVTLAQQNNPTAIFQVMDCRDISTFNQKFDAVICGFALPYLSEAASARLIADAAALLNPGGVLYISTMEEDAQNRSGLRSSSSGDQLYMWYHRAEDLTKALEVNGFTVTELTRQEFKVSNGGAPATDLIIIAVYNPA